MVPCSSYSPFIFLLLLPFFHSSPLLGLVSWYTAWWVDVLPYKYTNSTIWPASQQPPRPSSSVVEAAAAQPEKAELCDVQKAFEDTDHKGYK